MKHLLIAASVLAMSAGYAAADTTFTASASAGIAKNGTSNGGTPDPNTASAPWSVDDKFHAYSNFDIGIAGSGQTDSGLTFGASLDFSAGESYALADDDGFSDNDTGGASTATVFVSGTFGKITFSAENIDFFNSDVANGGGALGTGDVKYEGTFGGLGVGLIADIESGDMAVQGTYTLAGIALSADYNQDSTADAIWDASAAYTMGNFSATLSATNDNNIGVSGVGYDVSESLKLAYSAGGIGAWVKYNTNATPDAASFDVGGSYASGPMSVTLEADDVSQANGNVQWTVTGAYDLGGGLSLNAGTNYTGDVMVGATMSF